MLKFYKYSKGDNDEYYTPSYGVLPILKYIPKDAIVWCPFDTGDSFFVKLIKKTHRVVYSHIITGKDFFSYTPKKFDVIVSNPPFSNKRKIFERCLGFNKPFALLMTNSWLNDAAPKQLFKDIELQLLMFDKRIEYSENKKVPFSSSYFCYKMLPKQIIMHTLVKG
jgi:hypothetical protein